MFPVIFSRSRSNNPIVICSDTKKKRKEKRIASPLRLLLSQSCRMYNLRKGANGPDRWCRRRRRQWCRRLRTGLEHVTLLLMNTIHWVMDQFQQCFYYIRYNVAQRSCTKNSFSKHFLFKRGQYIQLHPTLNFTSDTIRFDFFLSIYVFASFSSYDWLRFTRKKKTILVWVGFYIVTQ